GRRLLELPLRGVFNGEGDARHREEERRVGKWVREQDPLVPLESFVAQRRFLAQDAHTYALGDITNRRCCNHLLLIHQSRSHIPFETTKTINVVFKARFHDSALSRHCSSGVTATS